MTRLERAIRAYRKAFLTHPLQRLKGKLPRKEWLRKLHDALNSSKEWMEYQNAWIAKNGINPVLSPEKPIQPCHPDKNRVRKRAISAADLTNRQRTGIFSSVCDHETLNGQGSFLK